MSRTLWFPRHVTLPPTNMDLEKVIFYGTLWLFQRSECWASLDTVHFCPLHNCCKESRLNVLVREGCNHVTSRFACFWMVQTCSKVHFRSLTWNWNSKDVAFAAEARFGKRWGGAVKRAVWLGQECKKHQETIIN